MNRISLEKQTAIRELYLKGYNDKLIADTIGISINSVKEYKRRYNIKLAVKNLYYKEKKRIKDICEELNLKPNQVRSYLNKIEIEELRKKRRFTVSFSFSYFSFFHLYIIKVMIRTTLSG